MSHKLSIVLPTYNELQTGYIQRSLPQLCQDPECEIIVVDRESDDGTKEFLKNFPIKLIETEENTRAARLNLGYQAASADLVLFHHPRSLLSVEAIQTLKNLPKDKMWGAFTHKFDYQHPMLEFTSRYSNYRRGDKHGIFYLDHCLFARKTVLAGQTKPFPEIDIFEDTEFCLRLRKKAPPVRLAEISLTSARRFVDKGVWPQLVKNFIMKVGYHLRFPRGLMNRAYERGLSLNSKY